MIVSRLFCSLLIASPTLHGFLPVQAWPRGGVPSRPAFASTTAWPRGGSDDPSRPATTTTASASWSSYITVDPSTILSLLVKKAGFFLDTELRSLADLLHCDEAQLNVVDRELVVRNFTVSLPEHPAALCIGRIHVTWDSYSQPCLEVQVENVDVLVEFTNLIFTRNNWNELNDRGFPPEMIYYEQNATVNATGPSEEEFLRIGSLDLQGRVVLHTRSRPLQKVLTEDVVLSLQSLKDLKYKVQALAEINENKLGRRGCTSDEVYDIFRSYFNSKIKQAIQYALEELAAASSNTTTRGDGGLVNSSKQVLASAKKTLLTYAQDVESLSKDTLKDTLKKLDEEDLLKEEEVEDIVSGGVEAIKSTIGSVSVKALKNMVQLWNATKNVNTTTTYKSERLEDDIMFPDW